MNGRVNDVSMSGAVPLALSAGFVVEEGLELAVLAELAATMGRAATAAGVRVVTGDTKVVDRGEADGLHITTAGVGLIPAGVDIRLRTVERARCRHAGLPRARPHPHRQRGQAGRHRRTGRRGRGAGRDAGQPVGREAVAIGRVVDAHPGVVAARTRLGATRVVDLPLGEQLPRIC